MEDLRYRKPEENITLEEELRQQSDRNLVDFYRKELEEGRWQDIPPKTWRKIKNLDAVHVRRTGRQKIIIRVVER